MRCCSIILGIWLLLGGCSDGRRPQALPAATTPLEPHGPDAAVVSALAQADFSVSPPRHPTLAWAELAPLIEAAAQAERSRNVPARPDLPVDPLAQRLTSAQARDISTIRDRALVLRADAARKVAAGDFDSAADALIAIVELARGLSVWGVPSASEASASLIELVLDALELPGSAPVLRVLSPDARSRLRGSLASLGTRDPAGRIRAMIESSSARIGAMRSRAMGVDGPSAVLDVAGRYRPGAVRATPFDIERLIGEAEAFSVALGDSWDRPMRSAVSKRLHDRQREDETGLLLVLMGHAPEACEADAALRARIGEAVKALR